MRMHIYRIWPHIISMYTGGFILYNKHKLHKIIQKKKLLLFHSLRKNKIWSFSHNYFHFDPLHGDFNIAGNEFQWDDGIFSITLGALQQDGFRTAYFHPMVG